MHVDILVKSVLMDGLCELGVGGLSEDAVNKIISYFNFLLNKNEKLNLISPKQDIRTQIVVHLIDSLSLLLFKGWPDKMSCMDFGSGGGLPAIPLSLARPEWNYVLIESTGKKALFLSEVKNYLKINNINIINAYLEPYKNPEKIKYDLITARAVSNLKKMITIAAPRLKNGGFMAAYKGPQSDIELAAAVTELKKNGFRLIDRRDFILPFINASRCLLIFEKTDVSRETLI